jgi:hypothetical protein
MYYSESVSSALQLLVSELEQSGCYVSSEEFERLGAALTRLDRDVNAYEKEQLVRQLGWLRIPETNQAPAMKLGAI